MFLFFVANAYSSDSLVLPSALSSDMVLPASPRTESLWGTAPANSTIRVEVSGAVTRSGSSVADESGMFRVVLSPPIEATSEDSVITISTVPVDSSAASAQTTLTGVAFGDIVVCGGQSNMQFSLRQDFNATAEIAAAGNYSKQLRLMTVALVTSVSPVSNPKLSQPWAR